MPSNHLILVIPFSSRPQTFPASGSFPMSQFFTSGSQGIGVSALASVLPMNIQSHHSIANRWGNNGNSDRLYFLVRQINADSECSREIKRCLLPGRKAMTNLDSILKSRVIILPTKFHLVKAVVFPVVMYGCESWTIKKAERRRIDAFELWCWRRFLRVPWTARRSNQSILKEISPEYSLEGLMLKLKLQYFGHLKS